MEVKLLKVPKDSYVKYTPALRSFDKKIAHFQLKRQYNSVQLLFSENFNYLQLLYREVKEILLYQGFPNIQSQRGMFLD